MAPGTSVERSVAISNTTPTTAQVAVYAAGADISQGNFAFAAGATQDQLSSWTSVSRSAISVAPGADVLDQLRITVPSDASSGARYAVLWAAVSAPAPTAGGVLLVNRVGVRMYLSIGPGGTPAPNFAISALRAQRSPTGGRLVVAIVHNNGESPLSITGDLTLSHGPGGLRAGPFAAKLGQVLSPGSSEAVVVSIAKALPRGPWRVDLSLRSASVDRAAVTTLTFPRNLAIAKTGTDLRRVVTPVRALLVVALVGLLALLGFHSRRRGLHATHRTPHAGTTLSRARLALNRTDDGQQAR
jgi:hypothetical protein